MLLHQDFEAALERHPKKVAIVCGSQRYTYCDVGERAQSVARGIGAARR